MNGENEASGETRVEIFIIAKFFKPLSNIFFSLGFHRISPEIFEAF
jgi:hypothetical protein